MCTFFGYKGLFSCLPKPLKILPSHLQMTLFFILSILYFNRLCFYLFGLWFTKIIQTRCTNQELLLGYVNISRKVRWILPPLFSSYGYNIKVHNWNLNIPTWHQNHNRPLFPQNKWASCQGWLVCFKGYLSQMYYFKRWANGETPQPSQ